MTEKIQSDKIVENRTQEIINKYNFGNINFLRLFSYYGAN